jgi:hypothetical protein
LANQLHQFGNALTKEMKDEIPEGRRIEQLIEQAARQEHERRLALGHAAGVVVGAPKQATRGDDAAFARQHLVERQLSPVRRQLHDTDAARQHEGEALARLVFVEQHGAGRNDHLLRFADQPAAQELGQVLQHWIKLGQRHGRSNSATTGA